MQVISSIIEFNKKVKELCDTKYMIDVYKAYVRAEGIISYKEWVEITVLNSPFYLVTYKN